MQRIEINVQTGEQQIIDLTPEEVANAQAQYAAWQQAEAEKLSAQQAEAAAKASALAKLAALGLTENEIASLIAAQQ